MDARVGSDFLNFFGAMPLFALQDMHLGEDFPGQESERRLGFKSVIEVKENIVGRRNRI